MMASRVIPLKARCAGPFELTIAEVETAAAARKHAGTRQQNGSVEIGHHALPGKRSHFDGYWLGKARNLSHLLRNGRGRLELVRNEPPLPYVLYGESPLDVEVTRSTWRPPQRGRVNQPMTFIGIG